MSAIQDLIKQAPAIMGIVNVTPDSFSDGGNFYDASKAITHGLQLLEEGAHILDIGGESTRPGAQNVSAEEEIRRVIPVIEGLSEKAPYISIDTRNAQTMRAAIKAGANIINDVSALTHDPDSIKVACESALPVCLMHMQGTPKTMQNKPVYDNIINDILHFFERRVSLCRENGIKDTQIILDPGIGFGKTQDHNLMILKHLDKFKALGFPVLLGASRKSFIGALSQNEPPEKRISGSLAAALWGAEQGADIIRVHDVKETVQALAIQKAIKEAD